MAGSKKLGGSRAPPLKKQSKSTTTTKQPKSKASSTTSKLLEIPAELRNRILWYALVSDEPVKVGIQFYSRCGRTRGRLTMLPGLLSVSKQLRAETQLVFFQENQFEIMPEVLKERSAAPLLLLRAMHRTMGLELSSVRICQEIKKRCEGELFQLKATFTLSMSAGTLTISDQVYSATWLGRYLQRYPSRPHIDVCGCDFEEFMRRPRVYVGGSDVVEFLLVLKKRLDGLVNSVSCETGDLSRTDEVVYRANDCRGCRWQGKDMVSF